jgi:hypothetical protein
MLSKRECGILRCAQFLQGVDLELGIRFGIQPNII